MNNQERTTMNKLILSTITLLALLTTSCVTETSQETSTDEIEEIIDESLSEIEEKIDDAKDSDESNPQESTSDITSIDFENFEYPLECDSSVTVKDGKGTVTDGCHDSNTYEVSEVIYGELDPNDDTTEVVVILDTQEADENGYSSKNVYFYDVVRDTGQVETLRVEGGLGYGLYINDDSQIINSAFTANEYDRENDCVSAIYFEYEQNGINFDEERSSNCI